MIAIGGVQEVEIKNNVIRESFEQTPLTDMEKELINRTLPIFR